MRLPVPCGSLQLLQSLGTKLHWKKQIATQLNRGDG